MKASLLALETLQLRTQEFQDTRSTLIFKNLSAANWYTKMDVKQTRSQTSGLAPESTSTKNIDTTQKLQINYLQVTSFKQGQKPQSAIIPEKFAIITCGLLIAVFAIPLFVVIQAVAAIFWGTITVFQLLNGKGLFNDRDEL